MISYEGRLIDCLVEGSKDERFNCFERETLRRIAECLYSEEDESKIITKSFGTGRTYGVEGSTIKFLVHDSSTGYNIGVVEGTQKKMTKAMEMLSNLKMDQIIRHKKEHDFYIERDGVGTEAGEWFSLWRKGEITVKYIGYMEMIIKHHGTRNWEVIESSYVERHPILSI